MSDLPFLVNPWMDSEQGLLSLHVNCDNMIISNLICLKQPGFGTAQILRLNRTLFTLSSHNKVIVKVLVGPKELIFSLSAHFFEKSPHTDVARVSSRVYTDVWACVSSRVYRCVVCALRCL